MRTFCPDIAPLYRANAGDSETLKFGAKLCPPPWVPAREANAGGDTRATSLPPAGRPGAPLQTRTLPWRRLIELVLPVA